MKNIIAKKEFTQTLRDKRFWVVAALVWGLLLTASVVGYINYQKIQAERNNASQSADDLWQNQGDKNPHSAAHYGSFAYRPKSPLSFVDFGTDSYTGMSVRLEAHKQNDAVFSAAQESSSLLRFGELTLAFVLQVLMPLLIIFLCFNTFTQEKEAKTLQILLSQGVSMRQIASGKIKGFSSIIAILVVPFLVVASILLVIALDSSFSWAWLVRIGLLMLSYLAYTLIFVLLAIGISAKATNSRASLLSLLVIWIFACVIIPKATVNIASNVYPVPTGFDFNKAIQEDEAKGIDGHNAEDVRAKVLEKQILAKYKVDSISQLPVNFDAIQMQEGEKYTSMVYQKHFKNLQETYNSQNKVSEVAGLLNPFLAIRQVSMVLSGSDYVTHANFQEQAETYRFKLVELLNNYMRDNSKTGDWHFTVNKNVWSKLPEFKYVEPSFIGLLSKNWLSFLSLGLWVIAGIWAVSKIKFSL